MEGSRPIHTPLSTKPTLQLNDSHPPTDQKQYRSVIGALQYLAITRPDIFFAVNKLAQFMHQPSQLHWTSTKRVLQYLKGTITHGISLTPSVNPHLFGYSDADWGTDPDNRHSTSVYLIFFRNCPISWSTRKQHLVVRSSTEAEYRALASTTSELIWIRTLLHELGIKMSKRPSIYYDNIGATQLSQNPGMHSRMTHIAIDLHFVRDLVKKGALDVFHVSIYDQLADFLTKPLSRTKFQTIVNKIGLIISPPILRERVKDYLQHK